jgi:hypothetical protein
VQQESLARRQRRDVAEQTAEGLGQRSLPTRPRATVTRDDQGTDDVAVLDGDGIDQDAPLDTEYHAGERSEGHLTGQLLSDALADAVEGALGVGADQRFEFETGIGFVRFVTTATICVPGTTWRSVSTTRRVSVAK